MGDLNMKASARAFSDDPRCLLKLGRRLSPRPVTLSDGTALHAGDLLVATHLWNDRLPERGAGAELLAGGRESLRALASHLQTDHSFGGARAIYGEVGFITDDRLPQARRIAERLGFDLVPGDRPGLNPLRRAFWRNAVSWLFLRRYNPEGLRRAGFGRMRRCELWMSIDTLNARYGHTPAGS